jgi:hypothetical protein
MPAPNDTGEFLSTVPPVASWPNVLEPNPKTELSAVNITYVECPPQMTLEMPKTSPRGATGMLELEFEP